MLVNNWATKEMSKQLKRVKFRDETQKWNNAIILSKWTLDDEDGYLLLLPPKDKNCMSCLVIAQESENNEYIDVDKSVFTIWSDFTREELLEFSMNLQKAYEEIYEK